MSDFSIDKQGYDGRWRVYWIGDNGLGRERLFNSEAEARRWVEKIEEIERLTANGAGGKIPE